MSDHIEQRRLEIIMRLVRLFSPRRKGTEHHVPDDVKMP